MATMPLQWLLITEVFTECRYMKTAHCIHDIYEVYNMCYMLYNYCFFLIGIHSMQG